MSKKKEQVKSLEKGFSSIIKAFKKEKDKKKRNEAFAFLTGRIAEFQKGNATAKDAVAVNAVQEPADKVQPTGPVVPSPALVEEIRSEHLHKQN